MRIPSSSNFKDDIGTFSFPPRVLLRRKSFPWRPGLTERLKNWHYDVKMGFIFGNQNAYIYIYYINLQVLRFEGYGILELMFGTLIIRQRTHIANQYLTKKIQKSKNKIKKQYIDISIMKQSPDWHQKNGHHFLVVVNSTTSRRSPPPGRGHGGAMAAACFHHGLLEG